MFETLTPRQVNAVVGAADGKDRLVVAHVGTWADAAVAVDAGIDALVHAPRNAPINDRGNAVGWSIGPVVPTLAMYSAASGKHESRTFLDHPLVAPYLDQDQKSAAQRTDWGGALLPTWFDEAVAGLTALHEAGVPILAGTDMVNPGTIAGVSLWHEIELLKQAGLSDIDVLAAATSRGADLLGLADRGRIDPGKRADLLLMNVTSIDEVVGSYDITAIWRNGHFVDRQPVARPRTTPNSGSDHQRHDGRARPAHDQAPRSSSAGGGRLRVRLTTPS